MSEANAIYLDATDYINRDHAAVAEVARATVSGHDTQEQQAIALFYWVRDAIRYNPYAFDPAPDSFKASATLVAGQGWCVPKAILLAALCRACGIPARLGFADVVNHLSTERLRKAMDSNVFYYHGYTSIYLSGKWVKATPAFNLSLCEKFGLRPLEFDGKTDCLYHEFDAAGNRHMEYVTERGEHADLPYDDLLRVFREHYPSLVSGQSGSGSLKQDQWDSDVRAETGS